MLQSLQLAHRLEDANILLIGGGEVAVTRISKLLPTGCKLTIVSPSIHDRILETFPYPVVKGEEVINGEWTADKQQTYRVVQDRYVENYLELESHWNIVLVCISEHDIARKIYNDVVNKYGKAQLINVADVPPLCNFFFGANLNIANNKIQILVSSNSMSPRFSALIRDEISNTLTTQDEQLELSIDKLGQLRNNIRKIATTHDDIPFRMSWVRSVTDIFGFKNCHVMDVTKLTELFRVMYESRDGIVTVDDFPARDQMCT